MSSKLQHNFSRLIYDGKMFKDTIHLVKKIYDSLEMHNQVQEGTVPYPCADTTGEGMAIQVRCASSTNCIYIRTQLSNRDLSFEYAGSKSTRKAICNISFSIKPGQLVVIVGANGSGKSSLMKILNRLYSPTSGTILIDGLNMSSYRISDLREATADLSQDHIVYPLSIGENIGLGCPSNVGDVGEVKHAAELGGALGFIEKFEDVFDTTLQPVATAQMGTVGDDARESTKKLFDKLEKKINISGAPSRD